jgi:hypothetical protein
MDTRILRVLRAEAAGWWRHRALRRSGDLDAARRLERDTIRRDLGYLRTALGTPNGYVSCGAVGTILHLGLTTVSTYAPIERFPLAALAVELGTPFVDTRPVADVISLANLPRVMIDGLPDPDPRGPRRRVPLATYLDLAERLGARIINDPRRTRAV